MSCTYIYQALFSRVLSLSPYASPLRHFTNSVSAVWIPSKWWVNERNMFVELLFVNEPSFIEAALLQTFITRVIFPLAMTYWQTVRLKQKLQNQFKLYENFRSLAKIMHFIFQ